MQAAAFYSAATAALSQTVPAHSAGGVPGGAGGPPGPANHGLMYCPHSGAVGPVQSEMMVAAALAAMNGAASSVNVGGSGGPVGQAGAAAADMSGGGLGSMAVNGARPLGGGNVGGSAPSHSDVAASVAQTVARQAAGCDAKAKDGGRKGKRLVFFLAQISFFPRRNTHLLCPFAFSWRRSSIECYCIELGFFTEDKTSVRNFELISPLLWFATI